MPHYSGSKWIPNPLTIIDRAGQENLNFWNRIYELPYLTTLTVKVSQDTRPVKIVLIVSILLQILLLPSAPGLGVWNKAGLNCPLFLGTKFHTFEDEHNSVTSREVLGKMCNNNFDQLFSQISLFSLEIPKGCFTKVCSYSLCWTQTPRGKGTHTYIRVMYNLQQTLYQNGEHPPKMTWYDYVTQLHHTTHHLIWSVRVFSLWILRFSFHVVVGQVSHRFSPLCQNP